MHTGAHPRLDKDCFPELGGGGGAEVQHDAGVVEGVEHAHRLRVRDAVAAAKCRKLRYWDLLGWELRQLLAHLQSQGAVSAARKATGDNSPVRDGCIECWVPRAVAIAPSQPQLASAILPSGSLVRRCSRWTCTVSGGPWQCRRGPGLLPACPPRPALVPAWC